MPAASGRKHFAGITVLLVDDEQQFRTSLALRLGLRGYEVVEAGAGHEAVQAMRSRPEINIVVLDQKMQGSDVSRILADMKQLRPEIPVILLTGLGRPDPSIGSWLKSIFACLEKPCDLDELIHTMEAACRLV